MRQSTHGRGVRVGVALGVAFVSVAAGKLAPLTAA
jgi:hypothetical protein